VRRTFGIASLHLLVAASTLALSGCFQSVTVPEPPATAVETPDPVRSRIVFTALQMVGVPYRYGGATPDGFDCSGLVQWSYRNAGVPVPRTSREQFQAAAPVPLASASPGDLVFFRSRDYSHVGIYVGENRFVHAPNTGRSVEITSLDDPWYQKNFVRAGQMPGLKNGAISAAATCGARPAGAC
jgi:cell wall-associated NlpC family hydrolase